MTAAAEISGAETCGAASAADFADDAASEPAAAGASGPLRKSLLRHSPAVVLVAILLADSNRHTDPDLWGHIRFGQAFIAGRHLIARDPYSYSAAGAPWHDYEWLAEVVIAAVYNLGGVLGLKLWKLACTALTILFITDAEAETGAPFSIQIPVLLLAALGLVLQAQFRPQMFTFVMLGAFVALLTRDNYRRDGARLWLVVPLMVLWVNLHAGFFIGIIALALYSAVATLGDVAARRGWRRGARRAALTLAAAAATLVNPMGPMMWRAVGRTLAQPYTRGAITEWEPTISAMAAQWRHGPGGVFIYVAVIALILGMAIAFLMRPAGNDLPLVAIAAAMAFAAWLSTRNMALAAIAIPGPLVRHLALVAGRGGGNAALASEPRTAQWPMFALCAFLAIATGLFTRQLALDRPYPAGALRFMSERGLHGNVLSEWGWGGYIIWHQAPMSKVFVDGRSDSVYPLSVIRDFILFRFDLPEAARVLDSYRHDYVLIGSSSPARRLMESRHDWKLLYRDNDALLYARANARASKLTGLPVIGANLPQRFP